MLASSDEFQQFWSKLKPILQNESQVASKESIDNFNNQIQQIQLHMQELRETGEFQRVLKDLESWTWKSQDILQHLELFRLDNDVLFRLLQSLASRQEKGSLILAQWTVLSKLMEYSQDDTQWQTLWIELLAICKLEPDFMAKVLMIPSLTWSWNDTLPIQECPGLSNDLSNVIKEVNVESMSLLIKQVAANLSCSWPESLITLFTTLFNTHKKQMDITWAEPLFKCLSNFSYTVIQSKKYGPMLLQYLQWFSKMENVPKSIYSHLQHISLNLPSGFVKNSVEKLLQL